MARGAIAVIDIRSADITALIGERGVNNTFVFKGMSSVRYQGFEQGEFFDERELQEKIVRTLNGALSGCKEKITELFIGVPGEFLSVLNKDNFVAFSSKRKISVMDIEELYENNFDQNEMKGYSLIKSCASYFVLSDQRREVNPLGFSSSTLAGKLCYIYCSDYFIKLVSDAINEVWDFSVTLIPSVYAQAMYLFPREIRDCGVALIDFGIYSTDVAVIYGDGLIGLASFEAGEGQILENISSRYDITDYSLLEEILSRANLFMTGAEKKAMPLSANNVNVYYDEVKEDIYMAVDSVCEKIYDFLDSVGKKLPSGIRSVYASGDGIIEINGAKEHLTTMLSTVIEIAKPNLPYYNKPNMSSAISVLDMAQNTVQHNKNNFLYKFIKKFGG